MFAAASIVRILMCNDLILFFIKFIKTQIFLFTKGFPLKFFIKMIVIAG
jgi:hypothetical protein